MIGNTNICFMPNGIDTNMAPVSTCVIIVYRLTHIITPVHIYAVTAWCAYMMYTIREGPNTIYRYIYTHI